MIDYFPLIALLRRRMSDEEEVRDITTALVERGDLPINKTNIQTMIPRDQRDAR